MPDFHAVIDRAVADHEAAEGNKLEAEGATPTSAWDQVQALLVSCNCSAPLSVRLLTVKLQKVHTDSTDTACYAGYARRAALKVKCTANK